MIELTSNNTARQLRKRFSLLSINLIFDSPVLVIVSGFRSSFYMCLRNACVHEAMCVCARMFLRVEQPTFIFIDTTNGCDYATKLTESVGCSKARIRMRSGGVQKARSEMRPGLSGDTCSASGHLCQY